VTSGGVPAASKAVVLATELVPSGVMMNSTLILGCLVASWADQSA
jgi:hypothetical protein